MKKIFIILGVVFLTSCFSPTFDPVNTQDDVIIINIKYDDGSSKLCWYKIGVKNVDYSIIKEQGSFWFRDTIGKYVVGEKINIKDSDNNYMVFGEKINIKE
jgi:hypothetical protein